MLKEIKYFELKMAKYYLLRGSRFIQLPKELRGKEAILNIQNFSGFKCFLWYVLAHLVKLYYKEHLERKYASFENSTNIEEVTYPAPYQKVPAVEVKNNLRINIYEYEEGEIYILCCIRQNQ